MTEKKNDANRGRRSLWTANVTVFLASMAIMIAELVAGRLISRYLGQSLYTWTSCIGVFLAGISIGNYLGGRAADRVKAATGLSRLFFVSAFACLLVLPLNAWVGNWPWLWEQSLPIRVLLHVTVTFLPLAVALGTISPVAARLALTGAGTSGRTIGQVYAWGAVGSIAGTFAAGFWLIAAYGTMETLGGVAAALAVLGLLFRGRSLEAWSSSSLMLVWAACAFGFLPAPSALAHILRPSALSDGDLIFSEETPYAFVGVRQDRAEPSKRAMILDRLTHSQVDLDRPDDLLYEYHQVFAALTETLRPLGAPIKTLTLGGGGFVFPAYLERKYPAGQIDVAEIDPGVVRAARAAFGLAADARMTIYQEDGRMVVDRLLRNGAGGYDLIYADIVGDLLVPYHLVTREFCEKIRDLLAPSGLYAVIVIDSLKEGELLSAFYLTMKEVFPCLSVVSCARESSSRDTFVLVGSRQALPIADVMARLKSRADFSGKSLTDDELSALVARHGARMLTDNYAPVENLLAGLGRRDTDDAAMKYSEVGIRKMQQGEAEEGIAYLSRAAEISESRPDMVCNLARAYADKGDMSAALSLLVRAVAAHPNEFPLRDLAGLLLARVGQVDAALGQWNEALRIRPDQVSVLNNAGSAWLMKGSTGDALVNFERAVRVAPSNALAWYNRGTALSALSRFEDARQSFEKAIEIKSDFAEAHYGLGLAFEADHQPEKARRAFRDALAVRPDFSPAQARLAQMDDRGSI